MDAVVRSRTKTSSMSPSSPVAKRPRRRTSAEDKVCRQILEYLEDWSEITEVTRALYRGRSGIAWPVKPKNCWKVQHVPESPWPGGKSSNIAELYYTGKGHRNFQQLLPPRELVEALLMCQELRTWIRGLLEDFGDVSSDGGEAELQEELRRKFRNQRLESRDGERINLAVFVSLLHTQEDAESLVSRVMTSGSKNRSDLWKVEQYKGWKVVAVFAENELVGSPDPDSSAPAAHVSEIESSSSFSESDHSTDDEDHKRQYHVQHAPSIRPPESASSQNAKGVTFTSGTFGNPLHCPSSRQKVVPVVVCADGSSDESNHPLNVPLQATVESECQEMSQQRIEQDGARLSKRLRTKRGKNSVGRNTSCDEQSVRRCSLSSLFDRQVEKEAAKMQQPLNLLVTGSSEDELLEESQSKSDHAKQSVPSAAPQTSYSVHQHTNESVHPTNLQSASTDKPSCSTACHEHDGTLKPLALSIEMNAVPQGHVPASQSQEQDHMHTANPGPPYASQQGIPRSASLQGPPLSPHLYGTAIPAFEVESAAQTVMDTRKLTVTYCGEEATLFLSEEPDQPSRMTIKPRQDNQEEQAQMVTRSRSRPNPPKQSDRMTTRSHTPQSPSESQQPSRMTTRHSSEHSATDAEHGTRMATRSGSHLDISETEQPVAASRSERSGHDQESRLSALARARKIRNFRGTCMVRIRIGGKQYVHSAEALLTGEGIPDSLGSAPSTETKSNRPSRNAKSDSDSATQKYSFRKRKAQNYNEDNDDVILEELAEQAFLSEDDDDDDDGDDENQDDVDGEDDDDLDEDDHKRVLRPPFILSRANILKADNLVDDYEEVVKKHGTLFSLRNGKYNSPRKAVEHLAEELEALDESSSPVDEEDEDFLLEQQLQKRVQKTMQGRRSQEQCMRNKEKDQAEHLANLALQQQWINRKRSITDVEREWEEIVDRPVQFAAGRAMRGKRISGRESCPCAIPATRRQEEQPSPCRLCLDPESNDDNSPQPQKGMMPLFRTIDVDSPDFLNRDDDDEAEEEGGTTKKRLPRGSKRMRFDPIKRKETRSKLAELQHSMEFLEQYTFGLLGKVVTGA